MSEIRQQYIPVSRAKVKSEIFQFLELEGHSNSELKQISTLLEALWHHSSHSGLEKMKELYENMDPDQIGVPVLLGKNEFLKTFTEMLHDGNWEEISDDELQVALEGEDVFPISLDVRFDELETMYLYKLGKVIIEDKRKKWFGLVQDSVEIYAYDRVIQIIEFKDERWYQENKKMKYYQGDSGQGLHIRLFKNIPTLDVETIFPNTSPSMRNLDKIKIFAPLIGGLATILSKYGPLLLGADAGDTDSSVIIGLLTALGTYMLKTYLSYQKTRENYQTQVSKDMYFKGQANNSAAINMVVDLSEEQEVKEALLAYAFILVEDNHSEESLDERIESWLENKFGYDIDFEVDDALGKLEDLRLLSRDKNGKLSVVGTSEALSILDDRWDKIYDY
tara:strand:- start:6325 stop:7500 length:1176 start_codon:yes stop_codon:yes gene_type:complete